MILEINADQMHIQYSNEVRKNVIIHRCHYAQLVGDNVLAQLLILKDQLTSLHISQLLGYASDHFCINRGKRKERYPLINYNTLEKLLVELCAEERSFQWSPETVAQIWQFLGTDCYQFYWEEFYHDEVFPDLIEKMTANWRKEDTHEFLAEVLQMDLTCKLQYDIIQMIAIRSWKTDLILD